MSDYRSMFVEVRRNIECYNAEDVSDFLAEAEQEIERLKASRPPGHVLVPVEPTEAMIEAGKRFDRVIASEVSDRFFAGVYRAMLKAVEGE